MQLVKSKENFGIKKPFVHVVHVACATFPVIGSSKQRVKVKPYTAAGCLRLVARKES